MDEHKIDKKMGLQKVLSALAQPLKYVSVSVVVFLCDSALFLLLNNYLIYGHKFRAYILGRLFGAAVGYLLNRRMVFRFTEQGPADQMKSVAKYALLASINTAIGWVLMHVTLTIPGISDFPAKLLADLALYVTTFFLQREVVFRRKAKEVKLEQ